MRWSWKIGEVRGIGIHLHGTFLILLAWVGLGDLVSNGPGAAIAGLLFLLALFACVVLHELGHALTAQHYGIRTRDITLLPIGGLARLDRIPDNPRQELWIALAGPAVNLVLAAALSLIVALVRGIAMRVDPSAGISWSLPFVASAPLVRLLWINLVLALFNLLPAFPMDGGRVLRACLAQRMEYPRATQIAAGVGQGCALVMGLVGLFVNPFLLFIALFVYMGAGREAEMVQLHSYFNQRRVREAMVTAFRTLPPDALLATAVEHLLTGTQEDFPVVEGERVVGMLSRGELIRGLAERGQEAAVAKVMKRPCATTAPDESLDEVFRRIQAEGCTALPVVAENHLVGLLTLEKIGDFVMVQEALHGKPLQAGALPDSAEGGVAGRGVVPRRGGGGTPRSGVGAAHAERRQLGARAHGE
jgi:Zn-dependent protease/CBS domain-containing protein